MAARRVDARDAFGDPFATDDYTLCVFGRRGRDVLITAAALAGGTCGDRSCWWRRGPAGIRFGDPTAPHGIVGLRLDAGRDGIAKVQASGKGEGLGLPPLPFLLPLTVQLQSGNGGCWESSYESPNVLQDERRLRARGPAP